MENRRNRASEELAETKKELFGFRSSSRANQTSPNDPLAADPPIVKIEFENGINDFMPADFLICEYTVDLSPEHDVQAIETSVVWLTEGKGDTDIGVYFFERRPRQAISNASFNQIQRFSTVLPSSPLSYEGQVLSVRWCVRVRIFLEDGIQSTTDEYFRLGKVATSSEIGALTSGDNEDGDSVESGAA